MKTGSDYLGAPGLAFLPSAVMVVDQRLGQLPRAYSLALRLQAVGADAELIADCLGIEIEGVGPLLRLAREKWAAIDESGKQEKH